MFRILGSATFIAIVVAAAGPSRAAVSFGSARVIANATADTNYGQSTSGTGFGTDTEALASYGATVGATASSQADSYTGLALDSTASALEESTANFASAASGTLDLAGITSSTSDAAGSTGEAYSEGQSASYNFSVDAASVFKLNYSYSESFTDPYFYNSIFFSNTGSGAVLVSKEPAGANTSGSYVFNLNPGNYALDVYTQIGDDAYAAGVKGGAAGNHEELYTFNIASAAPEPAGWALMLLGVGLSGLVLRGRRPVQAA